MPVPQYPYRWQSSSEWTQEELETIQKEICKIFDYFIEKYIKGEGFYWRFINHAESLMYNKQRFYSCGAGIVASYIRVDGEIFPCGSNTTNEVSLGNVRGKVNYGRIRFLMNLNEIDNEKCKVCYMNEKCRINSSGILFEDFLWCYFLYKKVETFASVNSFTYGNRRPLPREQSMRQAALSAKTRSPASKPKRALT